MIKEIGRNAERFAGAETKKKTMEGSEKISLSTDKASLAKWVKGAMERLDSVTDEKTKTQIMENCGYNCALHNKAPIEKAKARRKKFKNLDDFLVAEQKKPMAGTRLEREGDRLYWYFTPQSFKTPMRCFCGLLGGLPQTETVSRSYCNCSKGYVKKYWEGILGRDVNVDVVQTAVSGAKECKFVVHL
jgi:predicted hydrocarbon binding protein